ncbi:hypothetical protein [Pseudomonas sp. OV226]|uniref:hypothetical protein n=1 Tax=Pseudomonas sp. OV226 TaxID=2135588 RepID=UPI000D792158|nr:hypothetical protein [Pseudomonas sp. OV226]PWK28106.1 hypothetical protein C7534_14016 [Pseudomonas sp. OV226]
MRSVHLRMKPFLWMILAGLSGLNATQAVAETPGDQELIRQHQERLLEQQQRRFKELKALPGKAAQPALPVAPAEQHGCLSSNSVELFARGQHLAASATFAHSRERPAALTEREAPIYFSLSAFL